MIKAGWKGTLAEWKAKQHAEWKAEQEKNAKLAKERQEAKERERKAKEEATRKQLEHEMKTQPKEKVEKFKIIQKHNPMHDDYHVGIRKPSDIKTWEEAYKNAKNDDAFAWGDFTKKDVERALNTGTITIYSSYPIKQGVFVSTSRVQSEQYAGGPGSKVYKKTIPLSDVAWINGDEGQYAKLN